MGYVGLKFQDDRTRLMYSVHAEHIGKVTAVYLYQTDKERKMEQSVSRPVTFTKELSRRVDKVVDKTPAGKDKGNSVYGWRNIVMTFKVS